MNRERRRTSLKSTIGAFGRAYTELDYKPVAEGTKRLQGGQLLVAVSDAMVGLFRDFLGKGPERCKTYWAGSDLLVVLLGGGYTVAERTLFDAGQGKAVQDSRHALQKTLQARSTELVQELTGRRVVAFMSASHQDPDLSAELFLLASEDHDGPADSADQTSAAKKRGARRRP